MSGAPVKLSTASGQWHTSKWLLLNGFTSDTPHPNERASHNLLDGGQWFVPMSHLDEFHRYLAADLYNGIPVAVSEMGTLEHPSFVDIDGMAAEEPQIPHYLRMGQCSVKAAWPFLGRDPNAVDQEADLNCGCVVLATKPREQWNAKTGKRVWKFGVHIVHTGLQVDHERQLHHAEQLACDMQADAEHVLPALADGVRAHDLVDMQVYQSASNTMLRLPRVWKAEKCRDCEPQRERRHAIEENLKNDRLKRSDRESQTEELRRLLPVIGACPCGGHGRFNVPSVYKVVCVVDSNAEFDMEATLRLREEENILDVLRAASIRSAAPVRTDFVIHERAPTPSRHRKDPATGAWIWTGRALTKQLGEHADKALVLRSAENLHVYRHVEATEPGAVEWLTHIHAHKPAWQSLQQRGMIEVYQDVTNPQYPKPAFAILYPMGAAIRACDNVTEDAGGMHATSETFHIATPAGVEYQRCKCKKDEKCDPSTGRKYCACSDLKNLKQVKLATKLSPEALISIFGDALRSFSSARVRGQGHAFFNSDAVDEDDLEAQRELEELQAMESAMSVLDRPEAAARRMDIETSDDEADNELDAGESRHQQQSHQQPVGTALVRKRKRVVEMSDSEHEDASAEPHHHASGVIEPSAADQNAPSASTSAPRPTRRRIAVSDDDDEQLDEGEDARRSVPKADEVVASQSSLLRPQKSRVHTAESVADRGAPIDVRRDFIGSRDGVVQMPALKSNHISRADTRQANERLLWDTEQLRRRRLALIKDGTRHRMNSAVKPLLPSGAKDFMPITTAQGGFLHSDINTFSGRHFMLHDMNVWMEANHRFFEQAEIWTGRKPAPLVPLPTDPAELAALRQTEEALRTSKIVFSASNPGALQFSSDILNSFKGDVSLFQRRQEAPPPPDAFHSTEDYRRFLLAQEHKEKLAMAGLGNRGSRKMTSWNEWYLASQNEHHLFSRPNQEAFERIICENAPDSIRNALHIDPDHYKKMDQDEDFEEQYKGEAEERQALKRARAQEARARAI